MLRPHVVILGAGFGGVYVGKNLAERVRAGEIDVTIINRSNNFLFTPLLHEVATGSLSPRIVAESLREIFVGSGIRIIQATIESINITKRSVIVKNAITTVSISYDYLLVATGAETNYYGIPGAAENTLPLKTLADATAIRSRVIDMFERAVITEDSNNRKELLSFAVVGGGATGVEVAAELAEFVQGMISRYYGSTHCRPGDPRRCEPEEATITLIHAGKELLEQFKPSLRSAALDRLTKLGINVMVSTAVTSISKDSLITAPGAAPGTQPDMSKTVTIPASVIIWSAGVKPSVPKFDDFTPTLIRGRISVGADFKVVGTDKIFAMGDVAITPEPIPQLAQAAQAEAGTVAENIMRAIHAQQLKSFVFKPKGSMVSVGQWFAIGEIYSMNIAGKFTWWMWRTVYLLKFASWKKRIRIAFEWALEMFFPRDITKVT